MTWEFRKGFSGGEEKGRTRANISSMSRWGMVLASFLMKRKPWVEAAERTSWAMAGEWVEMSIMGRVDWDIFEG